MPTRIREVEGRGLAQGYVRVSSGHKMTRTDPEQGWA